MSSASSPIDRATQASTATPAPAIAPLSFLRRLAELTNVPYDPAGMAAADEHTAVEPTWQQTLELQCAPNGMQTSRVVWSIREAFGAAGRGCALVSTRPGPGGRTEFFALDGFSRRQVRVSFEAGGSRPFELDALGEFAGGADLDTPRSWLVVESCCPRSSGRGAGPGRDGEADPASARAKRRWRRGRSVRRRRPLDGDARRDLDPFADRNRSRGR